MKYLEYFLTFTLAFIILNKSQCFSALIFTPLKSQVISVMMRDVGYAAGISTFYSPPVTDIANGSQHSLPLSPSRVLNSFPGQYSRRSLYIFQS